MSFFSFFRKRSLPVKGDKEYRSLREYSDKELYEILENNQTEDLHVLAGICSEVLRRQPYIRTTKITPDPKYGLSNGGTIKWAERDD